LHPPVFFPQHPVRENRQAETVPRHLDSFLRASDSHSQGCDSLLPVPAIKNQQPATLPQAHAIKTLRSVCSRADQLRQFFMQKTCHPPLEKGNCAAIQHPAVYFILLLKIRIILCLEKLDTFYSIRCDMLGVFYAGVQFGGNLLEIRKGWLATGRGGRRGQKDGAALHRRPERYLLMA
jgi:hypothetical protein